MTLPREIFRNMTRAMFGDGPMDVARGNHEHSQYALTTHLHSQYMTFDQIYPINSCYFSVVDQPPAQGTWVSIPKIPTDPIFKWKRTA